MRYFVLTGPLAVEIDRDCYVNCYHDEYAEEVHGNTTYLIRRY